MWNYWTRGVLVLVAVAVGQAAFLLLQLPLVQLLDQRTSGLIWIRLALYIVIAPFVTHFAVRLCFPQLRPRRAPWRRLLLVARDERTAVAARDLLRASGVCAELAGLDPTTHVAGSVAVSVRRRDYGAARRLLALEPLTEAQPRPRTAS